MLIWAKLKKVLSNPRFTPVILLGLVVLSYGLFLPFVGLYMDDWYIIWFKNTFGALQFPVYFSLDRPLMGYFFILENFLLGNSNSPLAWQIFSLITRWLSVYALWGFLNTLWPNAKRQNNWVGLLSAVFPGFSQHWMIMYGFFYACLAGFFFSLTLMLKSTRDPKRFWLYFVPSLIIGWYSYASSEFYSGLELIRPIVLWIEYSRSHPFWKQRLWRTFLTLIPFGFVYVIYIIWRAFFFVSDNHKMFILNDFRISLFSFLLASVQKVYQAGVDALIKAWANAFDLANYPTRGIMYWVVLFLGILIFLMVWKWMGWMGNKTNTNGEHASLGWRKEALWLGLYSLVVAVIPFWAAGLPIDSKYPFDRFLLAYLFGSCLLLVALLETNNKYRKLNNIFLSILIAAGAVSQIANANRYKNLWSQQKELFWELNWRIPELKPGSMILTYDLSNNEYYSGPALSAQLNWTYGITDVNLRNTQYQFIILNSGQRAQIKELAPNLPVSVDFRTYSFTGNTSDSLYIYKGIPGCLRVMDEQITPLTAVVADYNKTMIDAVALSNLNLITKNGSSPNHPPQIVLGKEPAHTWCYYFEKAELARQNGDYDLVLSLLKEAQEKGYTPGIPSEWYPFIEAYAEQGDWEEAAARSKQIITENKTVETGVCNIWMQQEIKKENDPEMRLFIHDLLVQMHCR
ncbi:MAG: hypothetical protein C0410_05380 [Anaerolinea sp.]|nr:hypothetical protein [Anaerolinea sp.]